MIVPSPASSQTISSQSSEKQREETKKIVEELFRSSTNNDECWLETIGRPPIRPRTTDPLHRKIVTQIICQDIEDETPCVKLFSRIPEFVSKHYQRSEESKIELFQSQEPQWFGPLQPPPAPELYKRTISK